MMQKQSSNLLAPHLTEFDEEEQMICSSILKFCRVQENIPSSQPSELQKRVSHVHEFYNELPNTFGSMAAPISEGNLFRPSLHFRSGLPPPSLSRQIRIPSLRGGNQFGVERCSESERTNGVGDSFLAFF